MVRSKTRSKQTEAGRLIVTYITHYTTKQPYGNSDHIPVFERTPFRTTSLTAQPYRQSKIRRKTVDLFEFFKKCKHINQIINHQQSVLYTEQHIKYFLFSFRCALHAKLNMRTFGLPISWFRISCQVFKGGCYKDD